MDSEEFYFHFCTIVRRNGKAKLKQIAAATNIPLQQARKLLSELINNGKIKKVGAGSATCYFFK